MKMAGSKKSSRIPTFAAGILVAAIVFFAPSARPDTFNLTDGTNVIAFSLAASPTPTSFTSGSFFEVDGVSVDVNGSAETENLFFFNSSQMGGLGIGTETSTLLNQQGPMLYGGSEQSPTFSPQTFSLTNLALPDGTNALFANDFTLTITPSNESVPEPSSILLLGMGLMGLACAYAIRRKPRFS
jgi:PEP-CTERM motif